MMRRYLDQYGRILSMTAVSSLYHNLVIFSRITQHKTDLMVCLCVYRTGIDHYTVV
ncbi:MAG: hypothetical protein ACRCYN_09080 [Plesiomonas sp.]